MSLLRGVIWAVSILAMILGVVFGRPTIFFAGLGGALSAWLMPGL